MLENPEVSEWRNKTIHIYTVCIDEKQAKRKQFICAEQCKTYRNRQHVSFKAFGYVIEVHTCSAKSEERCRKTRQKKWSKYSSLYAWHRGFWLDRIENHTDANEDI